MPVDFLGPKLAALMLVPLAPNNSLTTTSASGEDAVDYVAVGAYALAHQPGVDRVRIAAIPRPRPASWDSR